eukprot:scaffold27199_cov61-Cyclotella_meneghiniana.AAC.1
MDTLAVKAFQSRPHNIIQYIHNETLGQSSSNGLDLKVRPVTDYVRSIGATTELFTLPSLKIQSRDTLAGKEFQSRPHNIIQYIHNETLGQSNSNGLDVKLWQTTELFTLHTLKIQPVATLAGRAFQSRPHNIIPYIHNETLGQSSSNGLDLKVCPVSDSVCSVGANN